MAVGFRNSSRGGVNDSFASSASTAVPSGAAADDIALLCLEQWESTNPTVTWPSGFTQFIQVVSGSQKLKCAWKRLTGADGGNYTASWTGSQWSLMHCVLMTGAKTSGDPVTQFNTTSATNTTTPSLTVAGLSFVPGMVHFVCNENSASGTPPTGYTETQDSNYVHSNYLISGSTGDHTASGGSLSTSTLQLVALIAVEPPAAGATSMPLRRRSTNGLILR